MLEFLQINFSRLTIRKLSHEKHLLYKRINKEIELKKYIKILFLISKYFVNLSE